MTNDKRRLTLRACMGALIVAGLLGLAGWLISGNEAGRLLVVVSLIMFALAYYVLETQYSGRG